METLEAQQQKIHDALTNINVTLSDALVGPIDDCATYDDGRYNICVALYDIGVALNRIADLLELRK